MKLELEEKIIILGSLFHDIGKFQQRCGIKTTTKHQALGGELIDEFKDEFLKIVGDDAGVERIKNIIKYHHEKKEDELIQICRTADHLSASERVGFDEEDDWKDKWSHKYLSSLFSKIYLNNKDEKHQRYYQHQTLTKKSYKILIPEFSEEKDLKEPRYNYQPNDFDSFKKQLKAVLQFYKDENDFNTLINLLLILFEKYMWCIPDFTGSAHTDISLFNHSKDVAGLAHAIFKSGTKGTNLNLIIGDLPGIQKYIFNVANKNPAKVLRGRSIFVQILTRQFATIIFDKLHLTDASLIMLAGGKFYIIAQDSKDFSEKFNQAKKDIEDILIKDFNYQLSFSSVAHLFNYEDLKSKKTTFGDIIDEASYKLLLKRNQQFENVLFEKGDFDQNDFLLFDKYIEPDENADSNSIKCSVTELPILKGHLGYIEEIDADGKKQKLRVDKQVENEYKIGSKAPKSNIIIEFDENDNVIEVEHIDKYKPNKNLKRILLNPNLDDLIDKGNIKKDILRNTQIIEVANYTTLSKDKKTDKNIVMDFDKIEDANNGAKFLTLIKGDVDNLGLIMSSGLIGNKDFDKVTNEPKDLTGISRTTTLSNHLKYFFSFSLNGFLKDWEDGKILDNEEKKLFTDDYKNTEEGEKHFNEHIKDRKVYTVFAGGDDLMLVCPQSSSLKLVNTLNKTFNDFVCENPEVHISYSLTNFKHNTPIRIVADMAEENQSEIKSKFKAKDIIDENGNVTKKLEERIKTESDIFYSHKDKDGIKIFNTNVKNKLIQKILEEKQNLIEWENDDENPVSQGIFRNLLYFSKIMKDFNESHDTRLLMWHPKLNYMINRLLKDKDGKYKKESTAKFFDDALLINKSEAAKELDEILYPIVCEAIYGTRKSKGE